MHACAKEDGNTGRTEGGHNLVKWDAQTRGRGRKQNMRKKKEIQSGSIRAPSVSWFSKSVQTQAGAAPASAFAHGTAENYLFSEFQRPV